MYVYNKRYSFKMNIVDPETLLDEVQDRLEDSLNKGESVLRFALVKVRKGKVLVEASVLGEER